jgi:hypothetical protein
MTLTTEPYLRALLSTLNIGDEATIPFIEKEWNLLPAIPEFAAQRCSTLLR